MSHIKRFVVIFVMSIITFSLSVQTSAEAISFEKWNEVENFYELAPVDVQSNSGLKNAQLKVQYDYPSHTMRLFFMLKFDSFDREENIGIRFRLNDGEEVALHLNGDTEYNEDKYRLEFIHFSMPTNSMVFVEVKFAVKDGIPDKQNLTVIFTDPEGQLSNTYRVDITPTQIATTELVTAEEEKKPSKTKKDHSSGSTLKNKTEKTRQTQAEETSSTQETSEATVRKVEESEAQFAFDGQKVLCISAAAIVAVILMLAGGMHFLKRKNHRGDED